MYTHQENVAETLQDSMLPHIPARMAGCDIATRYLPGTLLGRVGGDWFDAVKLPGARTALVVGDVMAAREAVSGVDIDEELTNMVMFQRAYEGAARMLTAVDQALDTLINRTGLVGR